MPFFDLNYTVKFTKRVSADTAEEAAVIGLYMPVDEAIEHIKLEADPDIKFVIDEEGDEDEDGKEEEENLFLEIGKTYRFKQVQDTKKILHGKKVESVDGEMRVRLLEKAGKFEPGSEFSVFSDCLEEVEE